MNCRLRFLLLTAFLCALSQHASANAGTPLMWAGAFHLLVGNLIIGVIEGLLLISWFRVPRGHVIGIMMLAKYASAWGGAYLVNAILPRLSLDLTNAWPWFWIMVAVTFGFTLVLE